MHIRIYASELRSYRDLPVRLAEFGTVYRWEKSGELGGMTRVSGFTQDDAHLFVTEDQLSRGNPRLPGPGQHRAQHFGDQRIPRASGTARPGQ